MHPPGGAVLPLTEYSFNQTGPRAGKPLSRCKLCRSIGKSKTVPASVFNPLLETLLEGRSIKEASYLSNIHQEQIRELKSGKRKRIYKNTFLNLQRAVSALPKDKVSIGPKNIKTSRNGHNKLSYDERIGLKKLVSVAQKQRFLKDKQLLKY